MRTIAECVDELITGMPFIEEGLNEGLINTSALARKIQPDVSRILRKPVQQGAIVMAIQRRTPINHLKSAEKLKRFFRSLGDLTVRSDLAEFTFRNSKTIFERHAEFLREAGSEVEFFCTFSQGVHESTIIISNSIAQILKKSLRREKLVATLMKLSSVTLRLPEENVRIAGIYYFILQRLAREGINIVEVISTRQEFTLVVKEEDTDRVFTLLMKLKRNSNA
jgi:hypothetical protein